MRRFVDDVKRLDIGSFPHEAFDSVLVAALNQEQELMVSVTTLASGGLRRWWQCSTCGRRARFLYEAQGAAHYACRRCCGLEYRSASLPKTDRLRQRLARLEARYKNISVSRKSQRAHAARTMNRIRREYRDLIDGQGRTLERSIAQAFGVPSSTPPPQDTSHSTVRAYATSRTKRER